MDFDHWDMEQGDNFRGRYETYLTDPNVEPRKSKWKIEVAIKLAWHEYSLFFQFIHTLTISVWQIFQIDTHQTIDIFLKGSRIPPNNYESCCLVWTQV